MQNLTVAILQHGTKIYKGKDIQTGKEVAIKRKNWYQYPKTPVEVETARLLEGKNHTCKLLDSYGYLINFLLFIYCNVTIIVSLSSNISWQWN